jgi:hypothetical protein
MRVPRFWLSEAERDAIRSEIAMAAELRRLTGREPVRGSYGPAPTPAVWLGTIDGLPYAVGATSVTALCAAVTRALGEAARG